MTSTNQRWYTSQGNLLFGMLNETGEVRVNIVERADGKAYIMAGSPAPVYIMAGSPAPTAEQGQWISNQLNGVVENEQYAEDFSWVQEMLDELLVPDERCRVAWGACRGSKTDTHREDFADVIALIIGADVFPDPASNDYFRIATFPIAPWADRRDAVEQGLRAMALQRYARESIVKMAAERYDEDYPQYGAEAIPLPGLRLTRQIDRERFPEETDDEWAQAQIQFGWDLTSARGGLDWEPSDTEG